MNAILLVLRTGMQWNALNATGICTSSSSHRRFLEWTEAGVFLEFWKQGLLEYQVLKGVDWSWLAMDGAMTKAPLGGEKNRPQPYRQRQRRHQAQHAHGRSRDAHRDRSGWSELQRHEDDQSDVVSDRDSAAHTYQ
jgi:transposase